MFAGTPHIAAAATTFDDGTAFRLRSSFRSRLRSCPSAIDAGALHRRDDQDSEHS